MSEQLATHDGYREYPGQLTTNQAVLYVASKTGLAPHRPNFLARCKRHGVEPSVDGRGRMNYYSIVDLDVMCYQLTTGRT